MPKKEKILIGMCGLGGSGKDTTIALLSKKRKCKTIQLRHIVENEIKKRGLPITNKTLRETATELRNKYGYNIIARKSLPIVKKAFDDADIVVINSIKSLKEMEVYKKSIKGRTILLSLYASPKTRFKRLSKRGLNWDMKDYKSFVWRDEKELGWGFGAAFTLADYMLVNEGSMKELGIEVDRFLEELYDKGSRLGRHP